MKIHVLGCSAAELPKSNLTGFLVDGRLLLDAGTIGSALDEKKQWKIKHVLLSHAHLDHIKDLPFLADSISTNRKSHHITVVSIAEVVRVLKRHIFNDIVWPDFTRIPTTANPVIRFRSISAGKKSRIDGYRVTAFHVNHSVSAVGYLLEDKGGKNLLYMGDSGQSHTIWNSLKDTTIDALIIEVSLPNRFKQLALNSGHLTPNLLAIELRKLKNLPKRIFITHCKPPYRDKIKDQLKTLKLPNVRILKDGNILEI